MGGGWGEGKERAFSVPLGPKFDILSPPHFYSQNVERGGGGGKNKGGGDAGKRRKEFFLYPWAELSTFPLPPAQLSLLKPPKFNPPSFPSLLSPPPPPFFISFLSPPPPSPIPPEHAL